MLALAKVSLITGLQLSDQNTDTSLAKLTLSCKANLNCRTLFSHCLIKYIVANMSAVGNLVPARFLTIIAHLVIVITIFWSRVSKTPALKLSYMITIHSVVSVYVYTNCILEQVMYLFPPFLFSLSSVCKSFGLKCIMCLCSCFRKHTLY